MWKLSVFEQRTEKIDFTIYQQVNWNYGWKLEKQIEFPWFLTTVFPVNQKHRDELYDRLIAVAEQHVRTVGPKNLKMDEIARDLGVSKKTIYTVIRGKEELIHGIIEGFVREHTANMSALIDTKDMAFDEKVEAYFNLISSGLKRFDSRVFMELERYYPTIHKEVESIRRDKLPAMLGRLMREGQKAGEVRQDLDIAVFSEAFLQAVQGMFRADSMKIHGLEPHEIPLSLSRLFIFGIRRHKDS